MKSKITQGPTEFLFSAKVLNKYDVSYYRCQETGFIQTEKPYWLEEAYSSAITKLDLGLPFRNEMLRDFTVKLLSGFFNETGKYLDFAGGYGLFTRMMRDQGYDFYHTDKYCVNIFAEYFDLENVGVQTKFELVTAFEVFEHMVDPVSEIGEIMKHGDCLFFTTELQPSGKIESVDDWWYFIPETGQHISLHTKESLALIANSLGCYLYTDNSSHHIFSKEKFQRDPFKKEREPFFIRKIRKILKQFDSKKFPPRTSLLQKDWGYVKDRLKDFNNTVE